ncbi:MAG: hypothetical protein WD357_09785 [Gracilimonas sp.]
MSNFFRALFFSTILLIGFTGCATTADVAEERPGQEESEGIYPEWFTPSGFSSDSVAFNGYATAVSSDSSIAMANAELQARINLESQIAERLESVRKQLEENGSPISTNTDFIITLRNAHNAVEDAAAPVEQTAQSEEGYYRGFAQVSITRSQLAALIRSGFSGKENYWEAIRGSNIFSEQ